MDDNVGMVIIQPHNNYILNNNFEVEDDEISEDSKYRQLVA